jgi:hypothetical protein
MVFVKSTESLENLDVYKRINTMPKSQFNVLHCLYLST